MKGIILYTSKYGATKRYAEWLKEATGFDCLETKNTKIKDVVQYDSIILGGGIYASGIAGLSFLFSFGAMCRVVAWSTLGNMWGMFPG